MNQQIHSKIFGQGPPLIIIHGLLGTLDNWQTIANKMSDNYTICLLDMRNHGKSFHSDVFNFDVMVDDLIAFMDTNWIRSANIIGHSMGGKAAMHLALREPDMVNKLVVADIGIKDYPPGHLHIFKALSEIDLPSLTDRKTAHDFLMNALHDPGVVQFLLKNLTREKDGSFSWKMNLEGIIKNYTFIMEGIHTENTFVKPTIFLRGDRSKYILDDDIPAILKIFPKADFQTIANAGHWLHADQPDEFVKLCSDFFDE